MSPRVQKLPQVTAIEALQALRKAEWEEIRQEGSNLRLRHEDHPEDLTIPMHRGDLPKGPLNAIIKQAGLTKSEFPELL